MYTAILVQIRQKMGLDAIGRDLNRVPSDSHLVSTVGIGWTAYIKYAGVIVIEEKARAFEMASSHSQDEARAHDFEGDTSL